jgi:hypothetical protein
VTEPSRDIRTDVPGAARIWNYWLGGKDNYEADRLAAEAALQFYDMVTFARQSRQFLNRVVRLLAAEAGIRQFLDVGTGLPTMQNTHEIAQAITPESRIVYVDNDRCKSGCAHGPVSCVTPRSSIACRRSTCSRPPTAASSPTATTGLLPRTERARA